MTTKKFNQTLDIWINALEQKTFTQICAKPAPDSWSLGQLYMHLIEATNHYLKQINICLTTHDNLTKEMSPEAKILFQKNEFPDEIIEGPPSNADTPQPDSIAALMHELLQLKEDINRVEILISKSPVQGKTKHPGLHYFNANEWFQFAEMHFRHHLRQKKRIEAFLNSVCL